MDYTMRRATIDDIPTIMDMLSERQNWLHGLGMDQWAGAEKRFQLKVERSVTAGLTWLMYSDIEPVGTLTLTTHADPDFWTPHERLTPALYMNTMATRKKFAGNGLGYLMLDWARSYAYRHHSLQRVRWDVWRTNAKLQDYYLGYGAKHLSTIEAPKRQSGALFESYYNTKLDNFSRVITSDSNIVEIPVTSRSGHWAGNVHDDLDHAGEGRWTQHTYRVIDELLAPSTTAESPGPLQPFSLNVSDRKNQPLIFAPERNGEWCIQGFFVQRISSWPVISQLVSGHPYRMKLSAESLHLVGYQPTVNI